MKMLNLFVLVVLRFIAGISTASTAEEQVGTARQTPKLSPRLRDTFDFQGSTYTVLQRQTTFDMNDREVRLTTLSGETETIHVISVHDLLFELRGRRKYVWCYQNILAGQLDEVATIYSQTKNLAVKLHKIMKFDFLRA